MLDYRRKKFRNIRRVEKKLDETASLTGESKREGNPMFGREI